MTSPALQIYQTIKEGGPSSKGSTAWARASSCGKQLRLYAENPKTNDATDALYAGTYFHKLKEHWWLGTPIPQTLEIGEVEDAAWAEAARCFAKDVLVRPKSDYGTVLGVELPMPFDEGHKAAIRAHYQGEDYEGRVDLLIEWTDEQAEAYGRKWDIPVRGGGIYQLDYKLVDKQKSADQAYEYSHGMQGVCYSTNLRLALGSQFMGTIFELTTKTKDVGAQAIFMPWDEQFWPVSQAYIRQAAVKRDGGMADPSACWSRYGRACVFLKTGMCQRY